MLDPLKDMIESLQAPQTRHAMMVHMPIVLALLAGVLALAAAVLRKNQTLRWVTVLCFAAVLGSAFLATRSGEDAEAAMGQVSKAAHDIVHEHAALGEKVWLFAAGGLVLAGLAFARTPKWLGPTGAWLAVAAGVATAGWVANTAHHGGKLVYSYGVGTPHPVQDEPPVTASMLEAIADPRARFFLTDVRPVLRDRCMGCHSGDDPPMGLDFTGIATLISDHPEHGRAIVPGEPDQGTLVKTITWDSGYAVRMPPGDREPLTAAEIAAIERWIREGAVWLDPPGQ